MMANDLYGPDPTTQQPTASGVPDHAPGTPAPTVRTTSRSETRHGLNQPVLVLVGLVGLAVLVLQVSLRGEFEIGA